jgi:hypothetical protein
MIVREMTSDVTNPEVFRRWSEVNIDMGGRHPGRVLTYIPRAIEALARAMKLAPTFPDVVRLLNLFFEHAGDETIFEYTKKFVRELGPKLLLQAGPQILVQLSHPTPTVAAFVHDLVLELLDKNYHEFIFSIIVLTKSTNPGRSKTARSILEAFRKRYPAAYDEVMMIRKCLLRVAVTWSEKVIQFITDAFEHYQRRHFDKMKAQLIRIVKLATKAVTNPCEMYTHFRYQYEKNILTLDQILKIFNPKNAASMNNISNWCKSMQDALNEDVRAIHIIQLSAISPELAEKTNFQLAVPGTFRPEHDPIRIAYFVGQFSVYASKQIPKDVIVKGQDGNFYQYLLKGHEDLRLDERIMQFFRLINSLVRREDWFKDNAIETVCVIPLSTNKGLVQWIPGTETLRKVVETYRKLHKREIMTEYTIAEQLSVPNFDGLQPIQKFQVIENVFKTMPDDDLAQFFWLKSQTAEAWLKQVNTFAISTGMTSIVGYVIGLGDRHPSNLLIDNVSGSVIHIDFGDCFEKAAHRVFLPEVVPFRLTRMMVKAMGAGGVDGLFRTSFTNMSSVLRDNNRVLSIVLAIFVQEPLIDPEDIEAVSAAASGIYGKGMPAGQGDKSKAHLGDDARIAQSVEMSRRVKQKLTGTDFEETIELSVEDQATRLIEMATNPYNLARMYSGWCPFW